MIKNLRIQFISFSLFFLVIFCRHLSAANIDPLPASVTPQAGHYLGYLLPDGEDIKIMAHLFMFNVQHSDDAPKLAAIMKLHLGDATSREYVSFFYPAIAFNAKAGFFNLDADDQDLTLTDARIGSETDSPRLEGRYHSANGQSDGKVVLFFCNQRDATKCRTPANDHSFADRKEISSLSGTYRGTCSGNSISDLKIETSKWHHSTNLINNPLPGYRITGRLSNQDHSCGAKGYCVKNNFSQGTYNFYHGFLRLTGQPANYNCHMGDDRLICQDHCEYRKIRNLYAPPPVVDPGAVAAPSTSPNSKLLASKSVSIPTTLREMNDYSGSYTGHLFHDQSQKFQPLKIKIQLYPMFNKKSGADYCDISLSAALFFGPGITHHQDFITVDFKRRLLPRNDDLVTFNSNSDVILNIKTWDRHMITGEWISKSYGLVGSFRLDRNAMQQRKPARQYISSIPGHYASKLWQFELTTLGDHEIAETESLIFPLPIHGNAQIPGLTAKLPIVRGSYDFYGNSLALELEDGRIVVGETLDKRLRLFWPPRPIWGVSDHSQNMRPFVRTDY